MLKNCGVYNMAKIRNNYKYFMSAHHNLSRRPGFKGALVSKAPWFQKQFSRISPPFFLSLRPHFLYIISTQQKNVTGEENVRKFQ
jgi:hypothetical protein